MSTGNRENHRGSSERSAVERDASLASPAPGKVTRIMPQSMAAPPAAFGQSRASSNRTPAERADPWLMDESSMSAMGLSPAGNAIDPSAPTDDEKCRHPVAATRRAFAGATASTGAGARVSTNMVGEAVDVATYGAAFAAGLLEGSWSAVVDLFQGAADMVELVGKMAWQLVTLNPGAVKAMLMEWVDKLQLAWANRSKIADDFMQKWESDDDWIRGNFQGEVLGWVMMTALLILATSGASAFAAATGRWASVLHVLSSVDALGDLTTYVAKLGRLPGKVIDEFRIRFGNGAAAEAVDSPAVKEGRYLTNDAGEMGDAGSFSDGTRSGGRERPTKTGGGRFGMEQDSGLDLLTDPHPPPEVVEVRRGLTSTGDSSLRYDSKEAFRKLVRELLARRAYEVDAVLSYLRKAEGGGLERVARKDVEEVFDYLFQSNGIQLDYANYAAWRRLSVGGGLVDDLRFIRHELEELKQLRAGGLEDPLGKNLASDELRSWQESFFDRHYLPAHRKALDVELEFLRKEIHRRTNGELNLSAEEVAMSDRLREEGKVHALRDGQPIEQHPLASVWDRGAESVNLSKDVAAALRLPRETTVAKVIQAVKTSPVESQQ